MDFAVTRFALAALVGGFWLPGHVHTQPTINHNVTIGSGGGYVLLEEDVSIQCSVKQTLENNRLFISIPQVTNCMGCRASGIDGNPDCDLLVVRQACFVDNGYLNAILIVFSDQNKIGTYYCDYDGDSESLNIALQVPPEYVEVAMLGNNTNNIEQNENRTLECKTSCGVVPDPQYEWQGQTKNDSTTEVTLPCTNDTTNTVAGSQLTIVWQQTDRRSNLITYKCCETDGYMCDDITIAHATVNASYVFSPDDGPLELFAGESMILNCTTDCPLAPLPELIWLNKTESWSENVSCGDDGSYLSVVSHLNVGWAGTEAGEKITIDYICCTSDRILCTNITVSHMYNSTAEPSPNDSALSTVEKFAIGFSCAAILVLSILLPVCCFCEKCPCYTYCRKPASDGSVPQTTEPNYNKDHPTIQMSENAFTRKEDN